MLIAADSAIREGSLPVNCIGENENENIQMVFESAMEKKHALLFSDPAKSTKLIFPVRAVERSCVTLSGQYRAAHTLVLLYI